MAFGSFREVSDLWEPAVSFNFSDLVLGSAGLGPRAQGRKASTCGRRRGGGAGAAAFLPLARFSAFAAVRKSSDCRRTEIGSLSPGLFAVQPASPQHLLSTRSVTS